MVLRTAIAVFLLDILTKTASLHILHPFTPVKIIPGFFSLSLVFNRGAAFGILPGAAAIFMILALATIVSIFVFAWRSKAAPLVRKIALGLICGGAVGNLLDRIRFGHVVDFLDFYLRGWHWPAFNVADSSLCIGAGLLLWKALFQRPPSTAHPS